jgi:hypothetical protein
MDLHEPSGLSSLTSLIALHPHGLRSNKPREVIMMAVTAISTVLPCLRKLQHLDVGIQQTSDYAYNIDDHLHNPCFGTAELKSLVSGCPDLQWLSITVIPRPAPPHHLWVPQRVQEPEPCSLLPLQGATCVTKLTLWANKLLQDSHLADLATLPATPQSLHICASGALITDHGVQQLSQRTALTRLFVDARYARGVSFQVAPIRAGHCVDLKAKKAGKVCHTVVYSTHSM